MFRIVNLAKKVSELSAKLVFYSPDLSLYNLLRLIFPAFLE
jgi:hypothetical protein